MVEVMALYGLRREEVFDMKINQYDHTNKTLTVGQGKGGKVRLVSDSSVDLCWRLLETVAKRLERQMKASKESHAKDKLCQIACC